jgi:hypothetical protein
LTLLKHSIKSLLFPIKIQRQEYSERAGIATFPNLLDDRERRAKNKFVRFEVLTAASMKMAVFWVVVMMEAASTSETLVNIYQSTRRNNPEDSHLQKINLFL